MRLTKKHFEFLASSVRTARRRTIDHDHTIGIDLVAESLAADLRTTNQAFDEGRFLEACEHMQLPLPLVQHEETST